MTDKQDAGADNLPPLPEPRAIRAGHGFPKVYALAYTEDQMREYALAALRAQQPAPQTAPVAALTDTGRAVKWNPQYATEPWVSSGYRPLYLGAPQAAGQEPSVKPWRERSVGPDGHGLYPDAFSCQEAEIADLRAELASRGAAHGRITKQNSVSNSSSNCTSEVAAQALDMGVEVKVERGRVWIVRGNQSFMLAYVPDEGDDPAEIQAYADNLRSALSIITPCVKSENLALDMGNRPASIGSIGDYTEFHRLLNAFTEAAKALDEATGKDVFDAADKFSAAQTALISYIDAWAARRAVPDAGGEKCRAT